VPGAPGALEVDAQSNYLAFEAAGFTTGLIILLLAEAGFFHGLTTCRLAIVRWMGTGAEVSSAKLEIDIRPISAAAVNTNAYFIARNPLVKTLQTA
jgi:hypothetical protein